MFNHQRISQIATGTPLKKQKDPFIEIWVQLLLEGSRCVQLLLGGGGAPLDQPLSCILTFLWLFKCKQLNVLSFICLQLVKYQPGGHYHAHLDSTNDNLEENKGLPCCFQTHCGDKVYTPEWAKCCRLCRYVLEHFSHPYCINNWATTCDFQLCSILTSIYSDEPVQSSFKLRNSKCCSVSSFTDVEYP